MTDMHVSKWHQEMEIFSQIKSALILDGNIFDSYPYPSGDMTGAWLNLNSYLHTFFIELGYQNVLLYNHIDGFSSGHISQQHRKDTLDRFSQLVGVKPCDDKIPSQFEPTASGAPYLIRDALTQTSQSTAIIMDMASRYVLAPDQMTTDEHTSYTILQQGILGAREVRTNQGRLRNMVVFITDKQNDIPAWMYLNISQIKSIHIDYPSPADRLSFLGGYQPAAFFDKTVYEADMATYAGRDNEVKKIIDRFVSRTEGFTYFELEQLRKLCRSRKIRVPDLCSTVDLYTYGMQSNPWQDAGLIRRLSDGEAFITNRVKGQQSAVLQSLDILKRAASGLSRLRNNASPKGVLFFAGPTGTGKTETAKTLAELVFGDEGACIRFDMSEYMHENSDQRLLGAPPGYVGYEAGGQLTNAVRRNPFSILLFDEIEKASPSIMDKFLQILEDGRMTDGQGNTVYFSDCIIIFTSNLGIYTKDRYGNREVNVTPEMPKEEMRSKVIAAIQDHFKLELGRPEILNRIGENIVVFDYISHEAAASILHARLSGMRNTIRNEKGIDVDFDPIEGILLEKVVRNLDNGGRGINNIIEKCLINPLARHIFDEQVESGDKRIIEKIIDDRNPTDIEWRKI